MILTIFLSAQFNGVKSILIVFHHHHCPFPEFSQTDTLSLLYTHGPSPPQPCPRHLLPVSIRFGSLCVCLCAKSVQSCQTLCDPVDCSLPGSSVHGTLQARILAWVAVPSSRDLSNPGTSPSPTTPALAGRFFAALPSHEWDHTDLACRADSSH